MVKMNKSLLEIHEDVSANHYDQGIKKNLLQRYWHGRRFKEVLKVVRPVDGYVLDVGCHGGTFTKVISGYVGGSKVYGIDISRSAIEEAKRKIPDGEFKIADATQIPFKNNFFEAVFCIEVLEHVDNPRSVIYEVKRVLKKSGYIIVLVPTDNTLFRIIWRMWTMYYPVWRHAHVQSFTGESLEKAIKNTGLKIEKVKLFNLGMLKLIVAKKI